MKTCAESSAGHRNPRPHRDRVIEAFLKTQISKSSRGIPGTKCVRLDLSVFIYFASIQREIGPEGDRARRCRALAASYSRSLADWPFAVEMR